MKVPEKQTKWLQFLGPHGGCEFPSAVASFFLSVRKVRLAYPEGLRRGREGQAK